ncbi:MAG: cell division ATP-binding protein FtsE [Proteobacteria bacterium]|nr:cell division ATP-binding protein FtsE [Pseudomonadota bacterium]
MITLTNVTKKYPNGQIALNNISLEIPQGEMVFLRGHSGAGKSTLLKLIALLELPTRGQIMVSGKPINQIKQRKIPYYRRHLGYITQNPKLLNNYTIFENVAMPLVIAGYDRNDIARRVRAALERVGLLDKELQKPPTLSEGEQQRVGIARAVVHKPRLLLADEPTGNLDPELSLEIIKLFERFHQVGVTVVIASHDVTLLEHFQYPKIHLSQGNIIKKVHKHTALNLQHETVHD